VDRRDLRIAELERKLDLVVARVEQLEAENAELRRRLKSDSSTSSKPPSSDGLSKRPARPRERGKRNPGKQPGSDGTWLMRVAEPDEVVEHEPHSCGSCGESLVGAPLVQTELRQVADLPPIRLWWTEHRSRRRRCACGHVSAGSFPEGVNAPVQYGPGMRAAAAYLCSYQHVPYERARETFRDLLGADVSTGWLAETVASISDAVIPSVARIADLIAASEVAHYDETGARVDGTLWWVHDASTDQLTHLDLHDRRGEAAMRDIGILPRFTGVAVHDGLGAYRRFTACEHALCGAHHLRELDGIAEHYDQPWAHDMAELLREIKTYTDLARAAGKSALDPEDLRRFEHYYDELIAEGWFANPPPPRTGGRGRPALGPVGALINRLDRDRDSALRFARDLRVPFDNNQAERDIRPVKVKQKITGGWRTVPGAMRALDLRSYIDTARKQRVSIIAALRAAAEGCPWQPTTA
jgi:transposase